jgi:hypothetical protein
VLYLANNRSRASATTQCSYDADHRPLGLSELYEPTDLDQQLGRQPAAGRVVNVQGETFDPVRTGFDHMGLAVASRDELVDWQTHFERHGVTHTPVVDRDYGSVLTFKDPDRIQFEMFYLNPELEIR